jgi:ankyrin repeat protein
MEKNLKFLENIGWTTLHVAAFRGDTKKVKELIERGADPNQQEDSGMTPLHIAARYPFRGLYHLK